MNLAIHDFSLLAGMVEAGRTRDWSQRKVVAWVTEGQFLGRPHLRLLQETVPLAVWEISQEERPFFLLFQERLRRRFSHREAMLLFLADRSGSVVLTGEPMVAEAALGLGLPVCSGEEAMLEEYFPLPTVASAQFSMDSVVQDLRRNLARLPETANFSPKTTPSTWRVPGRDEPVNPLPALPTRRSKGDRQRLRFAQSKSPEKNLGHG